MESVAHVLRDALDAVDLRHPLGHLAVHAPVVDFLERLALSELVGNLADEHHHRRGILKSRMRADRAVGGSRPPRHEQHARLAGQLAVGLGHVGSAAFLAADDEGELVAYVVQAVEHRQVTLAWHAESELETLCDQSLGEKCYKSLREVPEKIDIVDVFRKTQDVMPIAEESIAIGAKVLWQQLGVKNEAAAAKARAAGLDAVVDRCVKIEHGRLFGVLNWVGVNTRVISAKRPRWLAY